MLYLELSSQNILVLNVNISTYHYKTEFEKIIDFEEFTHDFPKFSFENLIISSNSFTETDITNIEEDESLDDLKDLYSLVEPPPVNLGGDGIVTIVRRETGESITVRYRNRDGSYDEEALSKISYIARCSLTHQEKRIPIKLVELIDRVSDRFGKRTIILLSGYRTKYLNDITPGAAKKSFHLIGWAMDIRLSGISSKKVKDFAKSLGVGGVGYYPRYDYVHLDIGKVRYWERYQYSRKLKYAKKSRNIKILSSKNHKYSSLKKR